MYTDHGIQIRQKYEASTRMEVHEGSTSYRNENTRPTNVISFKESDFELESEHESGTHGSDATKCPE